ATNLLVTAPTPDGALALPGPNTVSPTRGWSWNQARLDGHSSVVLTGTMRLVRMPPGEALLASAQATAQGLRLPIHDTGGALVIDRTQGPVPTPYPPGMPAVLQSADGHLTVTIPAAAAARHLTLRHTPRPNLGAATPPAVAGYKRGLGIFTLDATDDLIVSSSFRGLPPIVLGIIANDDQVKDHQATQLIGKGANFIGFGAKLTEEAFQQVG